MSVEQVIFINLLFYGFTFALLLWVRNRLSEQSIGLISLMTNLIGVLFAMGLRVSDLASENISIAWVKMGSNMLHIDLLLNNLTLLMYFVVQFIAFWVQLFSLKYMKGDKSFSRYFAYLNLFIFSMLGIVVSGNLLMVYFFWELVGLCSFLLIGFWYKKKSATDAAKKAFMMNRVGDIGFMIGIFLTLSFFKTLNITEIAQKASEIFARDLTSAENLQLTLIGISLFGGCMGKSAQFPLQSWLPDAMEGPTPASALIHAATMVAAGIFLMARVSPVLTPTASLFIASIGTITMLLGAFAAIFQYDIKKVLAYSTVSQLGLMVLGIGIGATNASVFHLITHAFFKAGLFLAAGAVIDYMHHEQDMRNMGNLRKQIPFVFFTYTICAASLVGLPFFSGFLSKDALIISTFQWAAHQQNPVLYIFPIATIIASAMTAFYMTRQFYMVFLDQNIGFAEGLKDAANKTYRSITNGIMSIVNVEDEHSQSGDMKNPFEKVGVMEISLIVMAIASFGYAFSLKPLSIEGSWFIAQFPIEESHQFAWVAYLVLGVVFLSIILSFLLTPRELKQIAEHPIATRSIFANLATNHFYMDRLYQSLFIKPLVRASKEIEHLETETVEYVEAPRNRKTLTEWASHADANIFDGVVHTVVNMVLQLSNAVMWIEKIIVDGFVTLVAWVVNKIGYYTRQIQGGALQSYFIALFVCIMLIMIFILI